jgi:hypothetical protein
MHRCFIFVLFMLLCVVAPAGASVDELPKTMLWAWQRPEELSFIDPKQVGVAYLACHLTLTADLVQQHWRNQPLTVPLNTVMEPVIRIDVDRRHPASFSARQLADVAAVIKKAATLARSASVQIDFDALETERPFYRQLLQRLHESAPQVSISITALASWCLFDNWIKDLPVEETVPMMFSLGPERSKILLYFRDSKDFLLHGCCRSLGLSLDDKAVNELMIPLAKQRKIPVRIYIFSRTAWNRDKLEAVLKMLRQ